MGRWWGSSPRRISPGGSAVGGRSTAGHSTAGHSTAGSPTAGSPTAESPRAEHTGGTAGTWTGGNEDDRFAAYGPGGFRVGHPRRLGRPGPGRTRGIAPHQMAALTRTGAPREGRHHGKPSPGVHGGTPAPFR